MTRPTTHWSLAGDLHAGAVDGCGRCEEEALAAYDAAAEQRYRDMTGMDLPREVRAERARANRQKVHQSHRNGPLSDLRPPQVVPDPQEGDK